MTVVKFRTYKKLSDNELLTMTYEKTEKLRMASMEQDQYKDDLDEVNSLIVEIKRRNLRLDKKTLITRILMR